MEGHVEHGPFHVDYIDSDIENAVAVAYGGYSFIGVTVALIYTVQPQQYINLAGVDDDCETVPKHSRG